MRIVKIFKSLFERKGFFISTLHHKKALDYFFKGFYFSYSKILTVH